MMNYTDFSRKFGIRRAFQLVSPALHDMQQWTLPRDSILHDLPQSGQTGIPMDDPVLKGVTDPIWAEHITHLSENRGNPRAQATQISKAISLYHRKNRRIRRLHDF